MTGREPPMPLFRVGQRVKKTTGDYTFDGVVVAVFYKRSGRLARYVVEDDRGLLFIFSGVQLEEVPQ